MKRLAGNIDYAFISFLFILTVFGLVMLASASSDLARSQFGSSFYYLEHQIIYGLIPGVIGFFVGLFVDYHVWAKYSVYLLILSIALLLLVFTPLGFHALGADRWLHFGSFSFQPGEIVKFTFIVYAAAWLSRGKSRTASFSGGLLPFGLLLGSVLLPLILQPATTTAVLIGAGALAMYFTAGAKVRYIGVVILAGLLVLGALLLITPYRLERVTGFLNKQSNTLGTNYQINQAMTAIGSGGLFGVGYGRSTAKLHFLPEPIGDSIFAVIGEELGFVGGMALVLLFLLFIWRGLKIAKNAPDTFGRLVVTGFMTIIGLQAFINIGAISGVIPLTGVPLPFVSYGGTALAILLTMGGVTTQIAMRRS
ncbi:putative lipid II flippase FtsW [Patescibacteria group bacterium]|nr:putative lipid II flippase FtsW [Patescibacteria group bacterium]